MPQFPCLAVHSEAIEHAFELGTLRYGRDGKQTFEGDHVAAPRRTVAHADLKEWLRREYPADAQKPHMAWLFDDVERSIHPAVSSDAYATLKAEVDALKRRAELAEQRAERAERDASASTTLDSRERASLLRIIRALGKMAKLPDRGAAVAVETQVFRLGFDSPKEATIRNVLTEAQGLLPDSIRN